MSLSLARELINYQNDGFKTRLVGLFEKLRQYKYRSEAQASTELKEICKAIFDRTGVLVSILVDTDAMPAVMPVFLTNCHVLKYVPSMTNPPSEAGLADILNDKGFFKGTIDFKNAKVSGDYSRIEAPVFFTFDLIRQLTPGAAAAILMHEVGHVWTCFALSWRTYRASQFIAAIHNARTGRTVETTYTHTVQEAAKAMVKEGLIGTTQELESLVEINDLNAQVAIVYGKVLRKMQSDFGSLAASNHHTESLADTFATRFGFGVELAEGLDSFEKSSDEGMFAYFSGTILCATIGGFIGIAAGSLVVGGIGAIALLALSVSLAGHTKEGISGSELYGTDYDRVNRIRLNVVDLLKDHNLKAGTRADLLSQADALARILSRTTVTRGLLVDIANLVSSHKRETKAALELERNLEDLVANDLFVGANKLKTLA